MRELEITVDQVQMALYEGQVFKNYRELCGVLGVQIKGGESKIAQLKQLARCCKFVQTGHKIRIVTIYDEMRPDDDGRRKKGDSHKIESGFLAYIKEHGTYVGGMSELITLSLGYKYGSDEQLAVVRLGRSCLDILVSRGLVDYWEEMVIADKTGVRPLTMVEETVYDALRSATFDACDTDQKYQSRPKTEALNHVVSDRMHGRVFKRYHIEYIGD